MSDDGQIEIVTGGGRGIGRAAAGALARDGLPVAVIARSEEEIQNTAAEIVRFSGRAAAIAGEVSDPDGCSEIASAAELQLGGGGGILVNAAGVTGPVELAEVDPADWQTVLDVNLTGALAMCRQTIARCASADGDGS
jgi:NAD(P)-dependent dehydrogenase (short-subunit alcohol dehydrogenase family)